MEGELGREAEMVGEWVHDGRVVLWIIGIR